MAGWWLNAHIERVGGLETSATGWLPGSKPVWLTETGCPAVDRGTNSPNLFPDPKSSEGGLPPFSRGFRDDLIQARFIETVLTQYDPALPGFTETANPVGPQGSRMLDPARIYLWAWDARPFPAFPGLSKVWADAADWRIGHWLNGRLEGTPLDRLLVAMTEDVDLPEGTCPRPDVEGFLDGYVLDRPMSMRGAIEPLSDLFGFDPIVSSGRVRFMSRARNPVATLTGDQLVPGRDGTLVNTTRAQESELPHELSLTFGDADDDYAQASVLSRRIEGWSSRQSQAESAVMTNRGAAQRCADIWLDDLWVGRESAAFDLDPRLIAIEPGDVVVLDGPGPARTLRISAVTDHVARGVTARATDLAVFDRAGIDSDFAFAQKPVILGPPHIVLLDLAIARNDPVTLQYIAAAATPWPGAMNVVRSSSASNDLVATIPRRATIGVTLDALPPGPVAQFDRASAPRVALSSGALASVTDTQAFGGANTFAIQGSDGAWEIFAACNAELVGVATYRLSRLLRGLGGEETLATRTVPAGATIVLLDQAIVPLSSGLSLLGTNATWRVGPANRDAGDSTYVSVTAPVTAKALLPYAPVQAVATRTADGIVLRMDAPRTHRGGRLGSLGHSARRRRRGLHRRYPPR